ncbi:MAG: hypothetical protein MUC49_01685 [Raineya sp.]|jgi:hypothetical protein|nr:hypothetical protein [Raineya sp.]
MKQLSLYLILVILLASCGEKEKKTDQKQEVVINENIPIDTMGAWVRLVMKESKGIMRGFELGDALDSIKKYEKAKIHDENQDKRFIIYTIDVDDDFVDITYSYNEQKKLKTIKIDAVVNGIESFLEDFSKFYDLRYGVGKTLNDTTRSWKSQKGYQVKLMKKKKESGAVILIE